MLPRPPWIVLVLLLTLAQLACSGPADPLRATPEAAATAAVTPTSQPVASTGNRSLPAQAIPAAILPAEPTAAPQPTPTVEPSPTATPEPTPTPLPPTPTATVQPSRGQTEAVPILMYHYVRPDPGAADPVGQNLSVTPQDFAQQIAYLSASGYHPMTMSELAEVRQRTRPLPSKPVLLTFDDGYRDFYTNAWPVLKQYNFKATSFLITGVIGQPDYLSWDMVKEMQASGLIEFGSHTVHHSELPGLSAEQVKAELSQSKQAIEQQLGTTVRSFCYPVGRFSDRDPALVRAAGYQIAVTTQGGYARADQDDELLPRVRIVGPRAIAQVKANLP